MRAPTGRPPSGRQLSRARAASADRAHPAPTPRGFDDIVRTTVADRPLHEWLDNYQADQQAWHYRALAELGDVEAWRDAVAAVRRHTLEHLDHYVAQFARNVEAQGGHVHFAATAAEARDHVVAVARRTGARHIVKAKSMVTSEIDLNPALEAAGTEVSETDLGEFIVQLSEEMPYHITGPALHKRLPEIRALFSRAARRELPGDVDALAAFARGALREKFLAADMGISGANFGVASTGTVVLVTNEGNGRMCTTLPRVHVVVMGMERLAPDWRSLEPLLTMLTRASTGERLTTYVSAITGPRRDGDVDGPEDLHVVIVDNGRSRILGTKYQPVLQCIRCGCCADFCPVYRTMGGYAYESVYTGPIGAVLAPLLDGLERHDQLPFASTLCGACQSACPARVPLADMLLELRADAVAQGMAPASWGLGFRGYAAVAGRPRLWRRTLGTLGRLAPLVRGLGRLPIAPAVARSWTDSRDLPEPARRSFGRLWTLRPAVAPHVSTSAVSEHTRADEATAGPAGEEIVPPVDPSPRPFVPAQTPILPAPEDRQGMLALFAERLRELGGTATRVPTRDAAYTDVGRLVRAREEATIACPPSLRQPSIEHLWTSDPRRAGFGLNEADWGIAPSATVVLRHAGERGRQYSLVPPAVGFLLPVSRLVPRIGPVLAAIQDDPAGPPACVTFVSGASHSGDIANEVCVGVHGPADVHVWLIEDE